MSIANAQYKYLQKTKQFKKHLILGVFLCGTDETRTRDLLRDRQAF